MVPKGNGDFYERDLSQIIEEDYQGDVEKFSSDMVIKFDSELKNSKQNNNEIKSEYEEEYQIKENEVIFLQEENSSYGDNKGKLSQKIEERILKEIQIIRKVPNTKLYSKEEAFSLIFGEDYINEELPN